MTKFRQNHTKARRSGNNFMLRIGLLTALLIGGLLFGYISIDDLLSSNNGGGQSSNTNESFNAPIDEERTFLPSVSGKNQLVNHSHYSLSYNEKYEIPEWVAYRLTRKSLEAKNVPRAKRFNSDPQIKSRSAVHSDYSHSGYTRGHMAPAGDMAFSERAMKETFYMSNMAPQIRTFNNGIWKELEEQTRDWAYKKDDLIVISGPIMSDIQESIGKNDIGVPKSFYKILVDGEGRSADAIGFIIPHAKSDKRLQEYAVNIDEIEHQTGIDFFDNYFDESDEEAIEGKFNINKWNFDNKRYRLRVEKWNNE